MQTATARFLKYLQVERNASELTIKSYREDLEALVQYSTELQGRTPAPGEVGTVELRGYIAA
ncbi:MAG: site-specific integrase, partial [Pirellulales bacterium]